MPTSQELPGPLALLARRNALEISDVAFQRSVGRLIDVLDSAIAQAREAPAPQPAVCRGIPMLRVERRIPSRKGLPSPHPSLRRQARARRLRPARRRTSGQLPRASYRIGVVSSSCTHCIASSAAFFGSGSMRLAP
jgi:hypothetical protein